MSEPFNIHDWQAKQRLAENDDYERRQAIYQKRQDRLTPGKNPDEFYGGGNSQESMSNANIKALQTVVGDYSLNKILNTIAVIADKTGKHDEADMIKKLASQIQDFEDEDEMHDDPGDIRIDHDYYTEQNEHHGDEDFPGKDLSAWDLLDKLKSGDSELYNNVEDFMKSMKEMSTTGTGASFNAGSGEGYMTPNAFKKKKK